jgi:hypothetical protein
MAGHETAARVPALEAETRRALAELVRCLEAQDAAGLERLFVESVRTITDGGGEYNAVRSPIVGRERSIVFHLRVARRRGPAAAIEFCHVNGLPAVRIRFAESHRGAAPAALLRCELALDGRIREIHWILASRKLTAVRLP